jgi:hypothetical protein
MPGPSRQTAPIARRSPASATSLPKPSPGSPSDATSVAVSTQPKVVRSKTNTAPESGAAPVAKGAATTAVVPIQATDQPQRASWPGAGAWRTPSGTAPVRRGARGEEVAEARSRGGDMRGAGIPNIVAGLQEAG